MYGTGETILFFLVFASQVLLISWFFPRLAVRRIRYVLENCPPSTHPKLYPKPVEHYVRGVRNYVGLNRAIVAAGLLIIVGLAFGIAGSGWDGAIVTPWSSSGEWDAAIVTPFFLVQMVPIAYLEFSFGQHLKAMAKAPPPRVRTTELRRRRLVDFVSPAMLMSAAVAYVAYVAFVLYYRRFGFEWFTAAGNILGITAMYLAMGVSTAAVLYGRKLDLYQADADRLELTRRVVIRGLAMCIAFPVLFTAQLIIKIFEPDDFFEPVITSVLVQSFAALMLSIYSYRVDEIDFDVYRRDGRDSPAAASGTIGAAHTSRS